MAKNNNISHMWIVQQIGDVIDNQIFTIQKRRVHAAAINPVTADKTMNQPENEKG